MNDKFFGYVAWTLVGSPAYFGVVALVFWGMS